MSVSLPDQFETPRLLVRRYRPGDGPLLLAVGQRNRAHLAQFEAENSLLSLQDVAQAEMLIDNLSFEWEAGKTFLLGAFDKATGAFVAQIYLGLTNPELPEFELGYVADCEHEGQGYVTEAARAAIRLIFEHLRAYRLRLECDDTNPRSSRVAERCGMLCEGHFIQNKKRPDGSITGTLHYRLLKSEFEK